MRANNIFKYIFIIFVLILISFSVYKIYWNKDEEEKNINQEQVESEKKAIVNMNLGIVSFDNFNPILSNNKYIQDISKLIYEPLLTLTQDYRISASLATECSKTSDTSYVLKLRTDVYWHDGEHFNANDVQFTIDRLKDENITSIYKKNVEQIESVEVLDDNTVKINLNENVPFFEYNLIFPIMPSHFYKEEDFVSTDNIPVGTGMFYVEGTDVNYIKLNYNNSWWNKDLETTIKQIDIAIYPSIGELYNSFKIGNIDMISTTNTNIKDYIGTIGFNLVEYKGREFDYIAINTKSQILSNAYIRKALCYAIDKNNIASSVYNNEYITGNFPLDYGSFLYEENKIEDMQDKEMATSILEENGWVYKYKSWQKKENYRTLRLNFNLVVNASNTKRVEVAENIKNQLEDMGIGITIIKASDSQYQAYLNNKNYDLILTGTNSGLSPNLTRYFGEGNLSNYENENVRNALTYINNIREEKVLKLKYKEIYDAYKEDMPYISLYYNKNTVAYNQNLIAEMTPNWYNIFYNIEKWYKSY